MVALASEISSRLLAAGRAACPAAAGGWGECGDGGDAGGAGGHLWQRSRDARVAGLHQRLAGRLTRCGTGRGLRRGALSSLPPYATVSHSLHCLPSLFSSLSMLHHARPALRAPASSASSPLAVPHPSLVFSTNGYACFAGRRMRVTMTVSSSTTRRTTTTRRSERRARRQSGQRRGQLLTYAPAKCGVPMLRCGAGVGASRSRRSSLCLWSTTKRR